MKRKELIELLESAGTPDIEDDFEINIYERGDEGRLTKIFSEEEKINILAVGGGKKGNTLSLFFNEYSIKNN
jgi:hypothetical protein